MNRLTLVLCTTHQTRCPICRDPFLGPELVIYYGIAICNSCLQFTNAGTLHAISLAVKNIDFRREWSFRGGIALWTPSEALNEHLIAPWERLPAVVLQQ